MSQFARLLLDFCKLTTLPGNKLAGKLSDKNVVCLLSDLLFIPLQL